jgi:hypothetical protein
VVSRPCHRDHAHEAYAGLASGYFIIDDIELRSGLPIPGDVLVFQDKVFYDPSIDPHYANYAGPGVLGGAIKGDLWYPYIYEPEIWDLEESPLPVPVPSAVPEMWRYDARQRNRIPVSGSQRDEALSGIERLQCTFSESEFCR